jgi:hypothetical protein
MLTNGWTTTAARLAKVSPAEDWGHVPGHRVHRCVQPSVTKFSLSVTNQATTLPWRPLARLLSRVTLVKALLPLFIQAKYPQSRYRHKPRSSLNSSQQS